MSTDRTHFRSGIRRHTLSYFCAVLAASIMLPLVAGADTDAAPKNDKPLGPPSVVESAETAEPVNVPDVITGYTAPAKQDASLQVDPAALAIVEQAEQARIAVIDKVYGSVVSIYGRQRGQGGGSGVLFHPDGYALTNFHVVRAAGTSGQAGLADGRIYRWTLQGVDPGGDLAIIRLHHDKPLPYAEFGDSRFVQVGDWVMAMGNPFVLAEDQRPTVTMGVVSGVDRYQPGAGPNKNLLEYGNCIQIDSSINPGNSGGPLFDMQGKLIGINGRGSFEERGRVNVGVGYAISIEQVKTFIPDLLATRTAMHGTLDAVFALRGGVVMCQSINLDSPLGLAGMRPGDVLTSFQGVAIESANQLKNEISMYPAGWPVDVVWRREDQQYAATVRLTAMPYGPEKQQPQARQRPPRIQPAPRGDGEDDGEQPKLPEAIQRIVKQPVAKAGEIRDAKTAAGQAKRVWRDWLDLRGSMKTIEDYVFAFETDGDQNQSTVLAAWRPSHGVIVTPAGSLPDPIASLAGVLAFDADAFDEMTLQGGDRADGQRCYRVLARQGDDRFMLWISLLAHDNRTMQARLVKVAAADEQGTPVGRAVIFDEYVRLQPGVHWPLRMRVVEGLSERTVAVAHVQRVGGPVRGNQ